MKRKTNRLQPAIREVNGCIDCFFRNDTYCSVAMAEGTGSIPLRYFEQDADAEVPIWCPLGDRPHLVKLKRSTAREQPSKPPPDEFAERMRARRQKR